jgi:2-polyprenyl-6-methoxyphenol hydroxylase-like FAD-dependent oxidoreductase
VTTVFVAGGGPAGLAAAIAARQRDFEVTIADRLSPPIDKVCGEGLMPAAVEALSRLGVRFAPGEGIPFRGIRFLDGITGAATEAAFPDGSGLGIRRTVLHNALVQRAAEAGVTFAWGANVFAGDNEKLFCDGRPVRSRWIIGADGQRSVIRRWSGMPAGRTGPQRFGFRLHVRATPWTDFVEVYWGRRCQVAVTPTGAEEIGLALLSRSSHMRLKDALDEMPMLAARLPRAPATTRERGAPCVSRSMPKMHRGNCVLVGDASGSVDPVTGEGLGLAFRQAISLAEAMRSGDLRAYQAAHRRICAVSRRMSRLLLLMDGNAWLRGRALRALVAEPKLFSRLLDAQVRSHWPLASGLADTLRLGWHLAAPSRSV